MKTLSDYRRRQKQRELEMLKSQESDKGILLHNATVGTGMAIIDAIERLKSMQAFLPFTSVSQRICIDGKLYRVKIEEVAE